MRRPFARLSLLALFAGAAFAGSATPAAASPRPLSDFLSTQGTYCLDLDGVAPSCDYFVPPSPNILGASGPAPTYPYFSLFDYAGVVNQYIITHGGSSLGTTVSGQINERPLADGRAQVMVTLHAKSALAWVSAPTSTTFPGPLVFGHRVDEVLAGATPSLVDCNTVWTFTNTAPGAALPDLIQLLFAPGPGQSIILVFESCSGIGELASGGQAQLVIRQTGTLFRTTFKGATADGFPVEIIALHPVG